jgi:hypothetical protein
MALHGAHQSAQKSMIVVFPLLTCAIEVDGNTVCRQVLRAYEFVVLLGTVYYGD